MDGTPQRCRYDVVVIGGGASGTLTAAALARQGHSLRIALVERRDQVGQGFAYGTDDPVHLLNVRAGCMSAIPDEPGHFLAWARRTVGPVRAHDYLPRREYGRYLRDVLAESLTTASTSTIVDIVTGAATAIDATPSGFAITLSTPAGVTTLMAPAAVLAVGHAPPRPLPRDATSSAVVIDDPWAAGALAGIGRDDPVVLVGTGLTAVDVIASLECNGHRAPIVARSRHGLLPLAHPYRPTLCPAPPLRPGDPGLATARGIMRALRADAARTGDWRDTIDALRPATTQLWRSLPAPEQARLLRHGRRQWDVTRHRMAPQMAATIDARRGRGLLEVVRGDAGDPVDAPFVVNCTGPRPAHHDDAVIASLVRAGLARPDPLDLGLDVEPTGALIGADGRPSPWLRAIGPLRVGSDWESTAIPELRAQAVCIAHDLTRRLAA